MTEKQPKKTARELLDEWRERRSEPGYTSELIWRQRIYVACHKYEGFNTYCVEPEVWKEYNDEYKAERSWKTSDERWGGKS